MTKRLVVAAAVAFALAGCSPYPGADSRPYRPPAVARQGDPGDGRDIYLRDCAWCHGNAGEGTERAPDLLSGTNGEAFTHFMVSSGRMPLDHPGQPVRRGDVSYSQDEIDAIVAYSATFDAPGPDIPTVDTEEADLQLGLELYHENCAACHATTGIGAALTPGRAAEEARTGSVAAPGLQHASPVQVAEAVRVGPGTMPVFAEETFDAHELDAIVAYVEYLQDPEDEGGRPLGRVGPVVEGAVGWVVGLGLLLLFIRWIGTKRGEL